MHVSAAAQKPQVRGHCEQRNPVAPQLGGGVPAGKGGRLKQVAAIATILLQVRTRRCHLFEVLEE